jgi:hypothetical protein
VPREEEEEEETKAPRMGPWLSLSLPFIGENGVVVTHDVPRENPGDTAHMYSLRELLCQHRQEELLVLQEHDACAARLSAFEYLPMELQEKEEGMEEEGEQVEEATSPFAVLTRLAKQASEEERAQSSGSSSPCPSNPIKNEEALLRDTISKDSAAALLRGDASTTETPTTAVKNAGKKATSPPSPTQGGSSSKVAHAHLTRSRTRHDSVRDGDGDGDNGRPPTAARCLRWVESRKQGQMTKMYS